MGGVGSGKKKHPGRQLKDAIAEVNIPKIVKNLEKWSNGKEVVCPRCDKGTGVYVPDTIALQSALELLNRRLGKVPQSVQIDITETIQLNADQWDAVLSNRLPQLIEMYKPRILEILRAQALLTKGDVCDIVEGEYKEEGITDV